MKNKIKKTIDICLAILIAVTLSVDPIKGVKAATDINSSSIYYSSIDLLYDGNPYSSNNISLYIPDDKDGDYYLVEGVDYTIDGYRYINETAEDVKKGFPADKGDYCAIISGIGDYTGNTIVEFSIKDRYDIYNWDIDHMKVTYTGEEFGGESPSIYHSYYDSNGSYKTDILRYNNDFYCFGYLPEDEFYEQYNDPDVEEIEMFPDGPIEPGKYIVKYESLKSIYSGVTANEVTILENDNLMCFSNADIIDLYQESINVNLRQGGYIYYHIKPNESGTYTIYTDGETDTYGALYDSEGNGLKTNDDDDETGDENFCVDNNYLYAGQDYYIGVRKFDRGSGSTTLYIDGQGVTYSYYGTQPQVNPTPAPVNPNPSGEQPTTAAQQPVEQPTTPPQTPAGKTSQVIAAKDITKVYSGKAFNLGAKTSGDGGLTYKSSNKKVVKVSNTGKVTMKGYGKATITINAPETANYYGATKKVTITVKPKNEKISASPLKGGIKISWKKDKKATGYQLQVSENSKFSNVRTVDIGKNSKTVFLMKTGSGKKLYVRVRAFKKSGGKKIYGSWSKAKNTTAR